MIHFSYFNINTKINMNIKEKARALVNLHLLKQITKPTDKIAYTTHECVHNIIYNKDKNDNR